MTQYQQRIDGLKAQKLEFELEAQQFLNGTKGLPEFPLEFRRRILEDVVVLLGRQWNY